jgi:hypothetical protein
MSLNTISKHRPVSTRIYVFRLLRINMQENLSGVLTDIYSFFFPLLTYLSICNETDACKMKDHVRLLYEPTLIIF